MGQQSSDADDDGATRFFFELTPDRILDAVETAGVRCTGRCMALNSLENRVYQVEIELDEKPQMAGDAYRVVKFYRPGRWSNEQILEEHDFLLDLVEQEIPVVAPQAFDDGGTLQTLDEIGIRFALFPRVGGRAPDELRDGDLDQLGRLLARVHNVGAVGQAPHRLRLDAQTYGRDNLEYLCRNDVLPDSVAPRYTAVVEAICELAEPWLDAADYQRVHGDCHLANILWGRDGAFLIDFDDMVQGPCVQDIWLVAGGRDPEDCRNRDRLLEAYQGFRDFDPSTLRLIEPLRALRLIHFSAWIAKRWHDPAFPRVFPDFGTERYWFEQTTNLQEQLALIQDSAWG